MKGLSSRGYAITIVSLEKGERFKAGEEHLRRQCADSGISWHPLHYYRQPPIVATLLNFFFMRRIARRLHRESKFSLVHCRSYLPALVGLWMKRQYGVKFLFDMRGFWADERVDGGLWNLSNPIYRTIYRFFKRKEKEFLKEADSVVSLTHAAKEEIESWSIMHAPITVIPTCVDLEHFDPVRIRKDDQQALREKLHLRDRFVLLYLGSLGTWYMVDEMLQFFSKLKRIKPDAAFLILTPDHLDLEDFTYAQDVIRMSVPRSEVPLYISLASLMVFFIRPSFSKKASVATKMAEALAMGIPVITNPGWGDVTRFSDALPGFFLSANGTLTPDLFSTLSRLDPVAIRNVTSEQFALTNAVARYHWIYKEIAH
jgi:glycosyltransferase involved in cell wall biosynthesis